MGFFKNIGATLPTFHFDDIASGKEEVPSDADFFIKLPNGEKVLATPSIPDRLFVTYPNRCHGCAMHELIDKFGICHVRCSVWDRTDQCRIIIKSDDLVKKFNSV